MESSRTKQANLPSAEIRGAIKKKLQFRTIVPMIVGLVLAAVLISVISANAMGDLQDGNIRTSSLNASYQISEYFTRYMEVSKQLAANQEVINYCERIQPGQKMT